MTVLTANLELDTQAFGGSERPADVHESSALVRPIRTLCVLRTAQPSQVAVDEKQIEVDGEKKWLYAAIDTESKLLLEIDVYSRRGTDPAAAFLHRLTEKHDFDETEFLVDAGGYLTALARHELSGQLNYSDRNHAEKWFQTVSMRIDRFHSFWQGSPASARRWLRRFRHRYKVLLGARIRDEQGDRT